MDKPDDIMAIYLYRRDVDAILAKLPPSESPLWNELDDSQLALIDALVGASAAYRLSR